MDSEKEHIMQQMRKKDSDVKRDLDLIKQIKITSTRDLEAAQINLEFLKQENSILKDQILQMKKQKKTV